MQNLFHADMSIIEAQIIVVDPLVLVETRNRTKCIDPYTIIGLVISEHLGVLLGIEP